MLYLCAQDPTIYEKPFLSTSGFKSELELFMYRSSLVRFKVKCNQTSKRNLINKYQLALSIIHKREYFWEVLRIEEARISFSVSSTTLKIKRKFSYL